MSYIQKAHVLSLSLTRDRFTLTTSLYEDTSLRISCVILKGFCDPKSSEKEVFFKELCVKNATFVQMINYSVGQ